jgi:integrase/recombinase XerD
MYQSRNPIKYLTREQTARFFGGIDIPRDRALFATIYHYGLRVSEATLLQVGDVDFGHMRILIHRVKHGIGGERPLLANTADLIQSYLQVRLQKGTALFTGRQGGLKRQRIQQLFRVYAEAAGLEKSFTVHCLRHSIATHLLEAGQGIEYVQDHLGHVNIQSTIIYAQITNGQREKVFRALEKSSEIVKV